ncbi:hypothetical protein Ancab_009633 [Ancistrocladus abbreviatus]
MALPVVNAYPRRYFSCGIKEAKMEKDASVADRIARMEANIIFRGQRYKKAIIQVQGSRNMSFLAKYRRKINRMNLRKRGVEKEERENGRMKVTLSVQERYHPHILLLETGETSWKLPGGRLKPGENEIEGLQRKLSSKLAIDSPVLQAYWQIGECLSIWWCTNFGRVMYPYFPPHTTNVKECKKLFMVHLPCGQYFEVPRNLKLIAVPLFELNDNVQTFGPVLSSIPIQLSRFCFNYINNPPLLFNPPDSSSTISIRGLP